jgi:hypothetical protein
MIKWISEAVKMCYQYIVSRPYLQSLLILVFFFSIFFAMYFSVNTLASADDHYFHFRFAQNMLSNGFLSSFHDFQAIYFSKMAQGSEYFVYYNFLFYLFILPFAFFEPLTIGIKLYAVCIVAIAFYLLFTCYKKLEIRNPFIWTVLIIAITSTSSIWRFFLSRPYALAPSLLLLLLVFLYQRKYIGVFLVSFLYLFWHSATFFLPLCVAVGYVIIERFYQEKGDYRNLLYAIGGTGSAILIVYCISPGFLTYIHEVILGTYFDTILGHSVPIQEGGELYPIDFFNFIKENALIFSAFVTVLGVDIFNYVAYKFKQITSTDYLTGLSQQRKTLQTTVLILTALFFLGTVTASGRFGDYFTFFAGLYIALSVDYIRRTLTIHAPQMIKRGIATGLAVVLIYLLASNMLFLQQRIAYGSSGVELYQAGMWLTHNSKEDEVVFLADWSWFPGLYFYSPKNNYTMGLEPRFMYTYSAEIYWLSSHISDHGYVCRIEKCEDVKKEALDAYRKDTAAADWAKKEGSAIADELLNTFKSKYVVTSKQHLPLNFVMDHSDRFERKLYNAEYGYSIYEVKENKK